MDDQEIDMYELGYRVIGSRGRWKSLGLITILNKSEMIVRFEGLEKFFKRDEIKTRMCKILPHRGIRFSEVRE